MAETVGFEEFVQTRSARLLQVAYMLTRDHALAEDLLQTALAKCWPRWQRIEGDPEPYVRATIVNTFNSWWQRRWRGERPTEQLPDYPGATAPQQRVDERDQVWRALRRLPRQQQIVVVLRYFEDLSEAQIAETMGVSTGAVKGYAAKALAKLRVDPTLSALPLPQPQAVPAGTERVAAVRVRIRHARRARVATVGAAVIVALALVAGYVIGSRIQRSHPHPLHPSPASIDFFDGNRVEGVLPPTPAVAREYSVAWTHESTNPVTFYVLCKTQQAGGVRYNLLFNGREWIGDAVCSSYGTTPRDWWTAADTMTLAESRLELQDVLPGKPSTFGIRFTRQPPPGTTIGLMVADRLPAGEYPLPSAPASLGPLKRPTLTPGVSRIDAAAATKREIRWGGALGLRIAAQTPGELRLLIDGIPVRTYGFFDFDGRPKFDCLVPSDLRDSQYRPLVKVVNGQVSTLELVPIDMAGDWYADYATGPPADRAILPSAGETCSLIPDGDVIIETPR